MPLVIGIFLSVVFRPERLRVNVWEYFESSNRKTYQKNRRQP
jgi:hypothetical protein